MNLDLFNNFINDVKEHSFTLNFINELTEYLSSVKQDILKKQDLPEFLSTDKLIEKYKISNAFSEKFYQMCDEILNNYAKNLSNSESIYYVSWNSNIHNEYAKNNIYTIKQYSSEKVSDFRMLGRDLPENIQKRYGFKEV